MRHGYKIAAIMTGIILITIPALADYKAGLAAYRVKDYKKALKEFKADPTPASNYNLGVMYFKGEGVKADHLEGIEWFRKSAEKGYAQAQYVLGTIYDGGKDVALDRVVAAKWYRKSAEQGHLQSQFNLGMMYVNGEGVEKDRNKAVLWLKKAARGGHKDAGKLLKTMGEEVPPQAQPVSTKIIKKPHTDEAPPALPPGHPK
jgi:TPR repeat protein